MPSCCASACLLLLLGVVIASGSPVPFHFPESLRQTHESLTDVLRLTQSDIAMNPLFTSVIRSINTSCQRRDEAQLMNATLDVYMRIFSSILQENETRTPGLLDQLPPSERRQAVQDLKVLQQKTQRLKSHLSHQSHQSHQSQDREDLMSKLSKMQVDDPRVQRKALAQFKEVFQAASVIGHHRCGPTHSSSD